MGDRPREPSVYTISLLTICGRYKLREIPWSGETNRHQSACCWYEIGSMKCFCCRSFTYLYASDGRFIRFYPWVCYRRKREDVWGENSWHGKKDTIQFLIWNAQLVDASRLMMIGSWLNGGNLFKSGSLERESWSLLYVRNIVMKHRTILEVIFWLRIPQ